MKPAAIESGGMTVPSKGFDSGPELGIAATVAQNLHERLKLVAGVAAKHADAVDTGARFPLEAMEAARAQRLLGLAIPIAQGGEGAPLSDVINACYVLGRACSATAMVFAMHQIKIACLTGHTGDSAWLQAFQSRVAMGQLLLASSTTEGQAGGDVRVSAAGLEPAPSGFKLKRAATVISYGAQADGVLTTARRSPDAAPNDQVLVALERHHYSLAPLAGWQTLGMRGTCSAGFDMVAEGELVQVFPVPYHVIHARTMMPVAHLTWSAVWAGIAAGALERARKFVRMAAARSSGQLPPGAAKLAQGAMTLRSLRHTILGSLAAYEAALAQGDAIDSMTIQAELNLLKVNASELATSTVLSALAATGLTGYRNDSEFSVGRHLRDVLSSGIMINNDRILANAAGGLMLSEVPQSLSRP